MFVCLYGGGGGREELSIPSSCADSMLLTCIAHVQGEAMVVYEDDAAAKAAIEWFNGKLLV